MTEKKVMHKGVETRALGIWDDLYRGLPGPVKSFLSVIIVSTTLMLGALFFTTQLLPGAAARAAGSPGLRSSSVRSMI